MNNTDVEIQEWESAMRSLLVQARGAQTVINIGESQLNVELAISEYAKRIGLSNHNELESDGMLFVYDEDVQFPYTFSSMKFDVNIYWFDKDMVLINSQLVNAGHEVLIHPPSPYRYVLETNRLNLEGKLIINSAEFN